MRRLVLLAALGLAPLALQADSRTRVLTPDDLYNLKDVGDPQVSGDGWVAYTVSTPDRKEDTVDADLYMVSLKGGTPLRLTSSPKSETSPRFSPDGRFIAFLSDRDGKKTEVWLLNRAGGDASKLTNLGANVSSLAWSPDSTKLALEVSDPDPDDAEDAGESEEKAKPVKPIVITRRQFMRDGEGYLRDLRKHIHVFDLAAKTSVQVTSGPYDDTEPVWTRDGRFIVFSSNRTKDPDSNQDTKIHVVEARKGATPRALGTAPGTDGGPVVSPDGTLVAYVAGCDPKDLWYGVSTIAVVPLSGSAPPRVLTPDLDRNATSPRFSPDGKWVYFLLEEGGNQSLARVSVGGGPVERIVEGERTVSGFALGAQGEVVVLSSEPQFPPELFLAGQGSLKRLTSTNDAFLAGIRLAKVERFKAKSPDGTLVDAFLARPPDAPAGKKLPTVLRIHGGPTSQYDTSFQVQWQILAAQGFAVVACNPRGSAGYGRAFARTIFADWGHKDLEDVLAAVDQAVAMGVADPERLGVGGWSYGGILTDYVITHTARFKAAISGAGSANFLADYGTDHYQYEWEIELGLPWKNADLWLRLSPWFKVEDVKTPTLFLCGERDMNVPLLNSEQAYQALRRLGVETQLVIYPGASHEIDRPTFAKDRLERYVAWYGSHLKVGGR
jgi:dipeptidyl aminopeptidase/acylaminoacyl peptidase